MATCRSSKSTKTHPDDGRKAILAAFEGHKSLKHCVIVDEDINIYDPNDVEWAISTRFQADKNLIVLSNQPGSSLDPSGDLSEGKKATTAKAGLDATTPIVTTGKGFKKEDYIKVGPKKNTCKVTAMELTKQEQAMLEGKEGYAVRKSMEILVALGEIFGAKSLIGRWQRSSCRRQLSQPRRRRTRVP